MVGEKIFRIGLDPEDQRFSSKLGRYFAATSYMEFSILMCMAAALGDGANVDRAVEALDSSWQISAKITKLETTAKTSRSLDDYRKNIILAACVHLRGLNSRRNEYAHGLFEHSDDGQVRLSPFGLKQNEKNVPEILLPERIEGDILLLDVMLRMAQFVAGVITREQLQPHLDRLSAAKVSPPA